jgi:hypothetical protein
VKYLLRFRLRLCCRYSRDSCDYHGLIETSLKLMRAAFLKRLVFSQSGLLRSHIYCQDVIMYRIAARFGHDAQIESGLPAVLDLAFQCLVGRVY